MNRRIVSDPSGFSAKKHLVLLADDDEAILEYLQPALTTDALSCITAASVAEAVEVLKQNKIALTVLDWGLDRSGAEVLRVARETRPNMPVIAISGLPYEVRTDAILQKADAFLHKPLSGEVLHSQVTQLLQRVSDVPTAFLPKRPEDTLPLDNVKSIYIRHVVGLLDNNVSLAARVLGIHRQTVSAALEQTGSKDIDSGSKCTAKGTQERSKPSGTGGSATSHDVKRNNQEIESWHLAQRMNGGE